MSLQPPAVEGMLEDPAARPDGYSTYFGEFRRNPRPLAAACLGVGSSLPFLAYTNSVFAPFLLKEFGWSRAQFALIGLTLLIAVLFLPAIGRFADRVGVRLVATIGTILLPLCFIAYSQMQGSFVLFLAIFTVVLGIASMTGPMVYTRLIAEHFDKARGLALTIVNCTPALLAMGLVPLLTYSIETYGWRISYLALGAFILVLGVAALLLIPKGAPEHGPAVEEQRLDRRPTGQVWGIILHNKLFWIIFIAFFLCLLHAPLHSAQMNIMLLENGLTPKMAANVVSIYAFGTIVGRITCGLALDRFSTPVVTAVSMGLPALGYFLLGTSLDALSVVTLAMFLVGLSVGAESDLFSFLVARYFKLSIFNSTLSLITGAAYLASASGSLLTSLILRETDSFALFLYLVTGAVIVGSALFLLMPKSRSFEKIG